MNLFNFQVVTQEVPGEISLCFNITGCPHQCKGCHSSHLWKSTNGSPLSLVLFKEILNRYKGLASCILFMGGEWYADRLLEMLKHARNQGFNTCLYSGADDVPSKLKSQLTWLKTGLWDSERGGLDNPNTNQNFIEVSTNKNLNYLFQTTQYDQTN